MASLQLAEHPYIRPPKPASKDELRTYFAAGYDWADVCDKISPARLSVYTPSTPSFTARVLHFLQAQSVRRHATIVTVLD